MSHNFRTLGASVLLLIFLPALIAQDSPRLATPDQDQAKRLNEVTRVLCEERGYDERSAGDLLDYVGHLLNR